MMIIRRNGIKDIQLRSRSFGKCVCLLAARVEPERTEGRKHIEWVDKYRKCAGMMSRGWKRELVENQYLMK